MILKSPTLPFLFAALLTALPAHPSEKLSGPLKATITEVVDGDTVKARVQIWLHQTIDVSVRLRGIDTPELRGRCHEERMLARRAQRRLNTLLQSETGYAPVTLSNISQGKYGGRVIAIVQNREGHSLGDILLQEKIAKPYQKRRSKNHWCS